MIKYYSILFFLAIIYSVNAQTGCYNADFSTTKFDGWRASYGGRENPNFYEGVNSAHHYVTSAGILDSIASSCGGELFMVPPGETHAARLGNNAGGSEADRLIYDVSSVTEDNNLFIYKYAVVLQDGGHDKASQPNFSVRVIDNQGTEIDPFCGVYNVSSGEPNQNANICGDIYWTQWNTVGINLSNYIGRSVSIEFTTRDCGFVKHFGYAYISAKCSKLKANVAVCEGGNNFTLNAPAGFVEYKWTHQGQVLGTSQSITLALADYPPNATFECLLIAYNNGFRCESTIQAKLSNPTTIVSDFSVSIPCKTDYTTFTPIGFQDNTNIINGVVDKWEWNFGDGKTSSLQNPDHMFENSGDYTVSLTSYSDGGCSSFISKPIHIENNPISRPAIPETQIMCHYPTPTLASLEKNGLDVNWYESMLSTDAISERTEIISNREIYAAITKDGCIGPMTKVSIQLNALGTPIGESNQSFCLDETAPTIASLDISGLSVTWYDAQDGGNLLSPNTILKNNVTYYSSDYDATTGCSSSRWGITVTIKEGTAVIAPDFSQEFCLKDQVTIENLNYYKPYVRYYSSINDTKQLPHTTPLENGTIYYAEITDPVNKCKSSNRTAILVNKLPCDVDIYNLITIDSNTSNDHLKIEYIEYFPDNSIQVFNRFGQLVYKTSGYGVDQNYFFGFANAGEIFMKNQKLPTGSYFYILDYKRKDLTNTTRKGFLYIHNND